MTFRNISCSKAAPSEAGESSNLSTPSTLTPTPTVPTPTPTPAAQVPDPLANQNCPKSQSSSHDDSDSDSSDSDSPATNRTMSFCPATDSKYVVLDVKGPGKLPVLSPGVISVLTLRAFKHSLCNHFHEKKINNEASRIYKMMSCCQDNNQEDWFENNEAALAALKFDEFFDQFAAHFRDKDWEEKLRTELITLCLGADQAFFEWALECQTKNSLLKDTSSFHSNDALICLLQANIDEDLHVKTKGCKTTTFKGWLDSVTTIDKIHSCERKVVHELISAEMRKRPASTMLSGPSRKANTMSTTTTASRSSS